MMQHLDLRDDCTIDYDESFWLQEEADPLFAQIRADTPWRQERGRTGPFPRLTAWYADPELTYSYSGVTHSALPWTDALSKIHGRVNAAAATAFNSVLLNYYRDGKDSMGFHSDDEPELGVNPTIASISFGAARQFVLKHVKSGETLKYTLAHGSLLVMGGACQHHWIHGIPKAKVPVGERINLTFRRILRSANDT